MFVDRLGSSVVLRSGVTPGTVVARDASSALSLFALWVARRYIMANRSQTLLLVLGVALSVVVFGFITTSINGLSIFLTIETTSKIGHVELEPPNTMARVLTEDTRFVAQLVSSLQRKQIRNWQQVIDVAATT